MITVGSEPCSGHVKKGMFLVHTRRSFASLPWWRARKKHLRKEPAPRSARILRDGPILAVSHSVIEKILGPQRKKKRTQSVTGY